MGEFFYRNGLNYAAPGFLSITAAVPSPEAAPAAQAGQDGGPPLVMFSGGKDSLALAYAIRGGGTDFFLYNPTSGQKSLAESLAGPSRSTWTSTCAPSPATRPRAPAGASGAPSAAGCS